MKAGGWGESHGVPADKPNPANHEREPTAIRTPNLTIELPTHAESGPVVSPLPLSSFLALILAGAVTVALWTLLVMLAKPGIPSQLVPNILAWLAYVVIV